MDYLSYFTPQKFDQLRQKITLSMFTSTPIQRPRTRCERLKAQGQSWSPSPRRLMARRGVTPASLASKADAQPAVFMTPVSKKDHLKTRARINVHGGQRFCPYSTPVRSSGTGADKSLSFGQSEVCENEMPGQVDRLPSVREEKTFSFGQSPLKRKLDFSDLSLVKPLSLVSCDQVQSVSEEKPLSDGQSPLKKTKLCLPDYTPVKPSACDNECDKDASVRIEKTQAKKRVSFGQSEIINPNDFHTMSSVRKMRQKGRLGYLSGVCSTPIAEKVSQKRVWNLRFACHPQEIKETDSEEPAVKKVCLDETSAQEVLPSGRPLTRVERLTRLPPMPSFGLPRSNSATDITSKQPVAADQMLRRCNSDQSSQSSKRVASKKPLFKHFRM